MYTPSKVGKCFLDHADSMRTAYTQYCLNHDKAEQLLEKFDALPEMQKVSIHIMQMLTRFYPRFISRCYNKVSRVSELRSRVSTWALS